MPTARTNTTFSRDDRDVLIRLQENVASFIASFAEFREEQRAGMEKLDKLKATVESVARLKQDVEHQGARIDELDKARERTIGAFAVITGLTGAIGALILRFFSGSHK